MKIKKLNLENFRVFEKASIEPSDGINVFYGDNAAGKTSILEAISVLSSLRSFRSAKISDLVRYRRPNLKVIAAIELNDGRQIPVGLEWNGSGVTLRAEGNNVNKASEIALRMPVQVLHPDSHMLVSGGPKQRRRFLDWGVFHVEHHYSSQWRRYERALRQRNAAIRLNKSWKATSAWDKVISEDAEIIHQYRQRYLDDLNQILPEFTREISDTEKVSIEYQAGWDVRRKLSDLLDENRARDNRRGFTCLGPHRADLIFQVDGKLADKHISRGQQKMLVFTLLLSQVVVFKQRTGENCVLLLDDLAAELDKTHRDKLMGLIEGMSVQTFATTVQKESLDLSKWDQSKLFHVEHGQIREMV